MVSYKNYVAGWFYASVHDFIEHFSCIKSTKFALITTLDSCNPSSLLTDKCPTLGAKLLGSGIILPTATIIDINNNLFFGFDEVCELVFEIDMAPFQIE